MSSGGTVYGNNNLDENCETSSKMPISFYGLQKSISETILDFYCRKFSLKYNIIRLSNPYGIYQNPQGNVGLIIKLIYQLMNNQPITIYGDGNNIRDYIYVSDAISMIVKIANSNQNGAFNVGSGTGHSILEIVSTIEKILKIDAKKIFLENRSNDVRKSVLNIDKYINSFEKPQFTSLEKGIKSTYKFLLGEK